MPSPDESSGFFPEGSGEVWGHVGAAPVDTSALTDIGRVLITHDWFVTWAGSERTLEEMLKVLPSADVVVGIRSASAHRYSHVVQQARESWLGSLPGARRHYQWFLPLEALAFLLLDTSSYDLVVSSSHAFAKAVRPGRMGVHVSYCYSPPRYLWDLYDTYSERTTHLRSIALCLGRRPMQMLDRAAARHVTHFVAISDFVARRIERVYGRAARVVYPPVALKSRASQRVVRRRGDFLLYLGRLVPYKRLDLLLEAAKRLDVRTVIAGDGPDRRRLEAMAGPTVEFVGSVSEEEAADLFENCAAFVFCAVEDFGIAPVEANAHGAPVVAYRGGGVLETMVEGATAEFFDEPTAESLATALRRALGRSWDGTLLKKNVERFSAQRFRSEFARTVAAVLAGEKW